jgi:hypothetical protein
LTANNKQVSKFVAGSSLDKELAKHLDEFDVDGHAKVKRMIIQEHNDKDFERLSKKIPAWNEFVSGKMEKLGIKKKGVL